MSSPSGNTAPTDGSTRIPRIGYLTLGSVRYGVRVAPRGGDAPKQEAEECCCGVGQLLGPSRIPLPAEKPINRRSMFSRGAARAAAPDWPPRSCGAEDAAPRRVLVRPRPHIPAALKLCASGGDASRLLPPAALADDADAARATAPRRNTLERLQRFRFGSGDRKKSDNRPHKKKPPRSSDKTERLRELTEKLKGGPASLADRVREVSTKRDKPAEVKQEVKVCAAAQTEPPPKEPEKRVSVNSVESEPEIASVFKEDDIFEIENLRLAKPESRTIVGSYMQRTIPIRSASFSQVDFSPSDGKYTRSGIRSSPYGFPFTPSSTAIPLSTSSVIAGGSLTLPRKKHADASTSVSPASSTTITAEEGIGSTPSVDSAVGSDEGLNTTMISKIPIMSKPSNELPGHNEAPHKTPGTRSLTYPLPRRGSRSDDDIPFSSIDGNGMKSLQYVSVNTGRELDEVAEEAETPFVDIVQTLDVTCELDTDVNAEADDVVPTWIVRPKESISVLRIPVNDMDDTEICFTAKLHTEKPIVISNDDEENTAGATEMNGQLFRTELSVKTTDGDVHYSSGMEQELDGKCVSFPEECVSEKVDQMSDLQDLDLKSNEAEENVYVTCWPEEKAKEPSTSRQSSTDTAEDGLLSSQDEQAQSQGVTCSEGSEIAECDSCSAESRDAGADSKTDEFAQETNVDCEEEPNKKCMFSKVSIRHSRESSMEQIIETNSDVDKSRNESRWSGTDGNRSSNEWCSANEDSAAPTDRLATRPKLILQSSDERDDECSGIPKPCPRRYAILTRTDSLSEGESDQGDRTPATPNARERDRTRSPSFLAPSDLSDSETRSVGSGSRSPHTPRRYSKRPLRGPYGQMLEAEMKKPETTRILSKLQCNDDLKFLEEYVAPPTPQSPASPTRSHAPQSLDDSQLKGGYGRTSPKRKVSANIPYSAPNPVTERPLFVCHQRTTSSPSQLEGYARRREEVSRPEATPELLAELLRGSSERLCDAATLHQWKDTRTHVVVELFDTERSYVESLQILVMKYLKPLKSPENSGLIDAALVDEIFFQVPAILSHHEILLEELRKRLDTWDSKQTVGDVFLNMFSKQTVIETYTSFINNWKTAKEAIKTTCQAKPAFARFLEAMAREHKGKLAVDSLLIKPVQRIPRYELLLQRLLKHTDPLHPDHQYLLDAQREIHDLAVKIDCTERETLEYEQQQQVLKELEGLIEGLINLVSSDRTFIRHDMVTMASGQGTRKERALFLFSDLLIITSIKRRSGTIRKPSTSCPGSVASTLEANKYKLLMRIPLDDLEIVKAKDENIRRMMREMETLAEDISTLNQITDLVVSLHAPHSQLEEMIKDMLAILNKQLSDRQNSDSQLSYMELTLNTQSGIENISVIFTKPEKKTSWEESFNEAKQKLALSADRRPSPEFLAPLPIRKTRAGLQFTCAAPTLGTNLRDVWVCNSDGYVGQVCVLSLQPEPTVVSCNGVCNARILCIASIPAALPRSPGSNGAPSNFNNSKSGISISVEDADETSSNNIELDSSSSSDEDEVDDEALGSGSPGDDDQRRTRSSDVQNSETNSSDDTDNMQPTMWLGTEDGCIHVYNCSDNIRIKKNKVKIQHGSSVHCIIYLDNRVFVSLANGDICVYARDQNGGWNTVEPFTVAIGTVAMPVTRMIPIAGKLWCGCHNSIKVLNTTTLKVEHSFQVNADSGRSVTCMATSSLGVWVSLQNSAVVRLFHATTYECLCDVNVAPAVTKMLASCDDIIRQHKAACLRVTALLACKDLLWVGTSAGVILTMPLPHIAPSTTKLNNPPTATGVPHGHTGHVRFLTCLETGQSQSGDTLVVRQSAQYRYSLKSKPDLLSHQGANSPNSKLLVISGGDGYEDFRTSSASEVAGREDSTNHLLLWSV